MRVLLVEPDYRRMSPGRVRSRKNGKQDDDSLWYPPLGLMKLSRFHKDRGDEVQFAYGCEKSLFRDSDLFDPQALWDRVYITTLFTYGWKRTIETITFYKEAVGGTVGRIYVGGIMASLMGK